jgi:hypothetical protein
LYDTEGGWLHLTTEELVAGAKSSAAAGWGGIKVKVGKPTADEDLERLTAVPEAVGARFDLMVDANQSMTSAEAIRRAEAFAPVDLFWLEEPMPADDVSGHQRLAESTSIPIAVGESMYSIAQFRDYLQRGAASIVQVDVARIGGITAQSGAPGRDGQRRSLPALPDGAAREPHRGDPQRPVRRTHPAASGDHHRGDGDRGRPRGRARITGPRHRLGPWRDGRQEGGVNTAEQGRGTGSNHSTRPCDTVAEVAT